MYNALGIHVCVQQTNYFLYKRTSCCRNAILIGQSIFQCGCAYGRHDISTDPWSGHAAWCAVRDLRSSFSFWTIALIYGFSSFCSEDCWHLRGSQTSTAVSSLTTDGSQLLTNLFVLRSNIALYDSVFYPCIEHKKPYSTLEQKQ